MLHYLKDNYYAILLGVAIALFLFLAGFVLAEVTTPPLSTDLIDTMRRIVEKHDALP